MKNSVLQGLGKVVTAFLGIILSWILWAKLKNDGYGVYVFVSAFVLFFGNIADWGTNLIAVREASRQDSSPRNVIFTTSIAFRLALSLVSVIILNIVIRVNPEWQQFILPTTIASFVLLFLSVKSSMGIVFQTLLRFDLITLMEVLLSGLFFLVAAIFLRQNFGVEYVMLSWVFATAASALLGVLLGRKNLAGFSFNWPLTKRILREALPTGTLLIVFSVYNRLDVIILQHYWGNSDVGVYGLSYKIYETLVVGAAFVMNAAYPLLSKAQGGQYLKDVYQKAFDLLLVGALMVFGVSFFLSPVLTLFLGETAAPSVHILRILSFALVFSYFNHLTGYSLIALGKQKISLAIATLALVFNLVLNILFVPVFSYNAAAVITILTEGLVFVVSTYFVFKNLEYLPSLTTFPKTIYSLMFRKD